MARSNSKVGADIAVIKTQIVNLSNNFEEYKNDNKEFVKSITKRVNDVENYQIATAQKVSNLAVFQTVFSTIIGGIASFLGMKK